MALSNWLSFSATGRDPVPVAVSAARGASQIEHHNNYNLVRLLAAVQVLVIHVAESYGYRNAFLEALKLIPGVPTFFFISGYLIYTSYVRTRSRGLGAFATNRVLRIFPALWVCVALSTLSVIASGYLHAHPVGLMKFVAWVVAQASFFQFYNPDFMRSYGVGVLNGSLWTISVELQFYILTPVLAYLLHSRRLVFAALFVLSMALNLYLRFHLKWDVLWMKLVYVSFASWVFMYMTGMLAAYYTDIAERAARLPYIALILAIVLSQNFIGTYGMNASNGINPVSFLFVGILVVKFSTQKIWGLTSFQKFIQRSDFSYGIYLYHMPVINFLIFSAVFSKFASAMLILPAAAFAAVLSWYFVEKPALLHKK